MHTLDGRNLTLEVLPQVVKGGFQFDIAEDALQRMAASRKIVESVVSAGRVVYGVNTGFGKLSEIRIPNDDLRSLQRNLVLSHACGVGEPLPANEVRCMLLLKINSLLTGYSGCRPVIVEYLRRLLIQDILPVIPEKGSVGASGDLAPLAHMALVLLGLGEAGKEGKVISGAEALKLIGEPALELEAKEGLALLNGTQFMTAIGALALQQLEILTKTADICGAMTAEALLCTPAAFDPRIQIARGFAGQQQSASNLIRLMADSPIRASHLACSRVQDAYSVRCMPQVHGAVRDYLMTLKETFAVELNAATDNPLVFAEDAEVLSGGNFHGQPISTACDLLAILSTQLANISERRISFMMDPVLSELPGFLTSHGGLNSGFMISQVCAADLVSQNKRLSQPASVDSIPTSANKEDFVSMGAAAAVKARQAAKNAAQVLGIELLCACQALDLRAPLEPGPATHAVKKLVREIIPELKEDRLMANELQTAAKLVSSGQVLQAAEGVVGEL